MRGQVPGLSRAQRAAFLASSACVDLEQPALRSQASQLAEGLSSPLAIAAACYHFVRDAIAHSWDQRQGPLTCSASEVLRQRTGFCYAKSHLLAALLRANGIPAGFCYQRLQGYAPGEFCLHGLNALYLEGLGWYRVDARGNKPGLDARFDPPREQLAWPADQEGEWNHPAVLAEPLDCVLEALGRAGSIEALAQNLPDATALGEFSSRGTALPLVLAA